jgi:hypothetical protein
MTGLDARNLQTIVLVFFPNSLRFDTLVWFEVRVKFNSFEPLVPSEFQDLFLLKSLVPWFPENKTILA